MALPGDRLHFTFWKDELPIEATQTGLRWRKYGDGCFADEAIVPIIASIEQARCAGELQFCLTLSETRTNANVQFAILIGKKNYFGTFSEDYTSPANYLEAVRLWLQKSKIVKQVVVTGLVVCVTIARVVDCCDLDGQLVEIVLGTPAEQNSNLPTLQKKYLGGITRDANDVYDMFVGNDIVEGNVFSFGNRSYTAQLGDTWRTVQAHFTESGRVLMPAGVSPLLSALVGGISAINGNNPAIVASFEETSGLIDRYKIVVGVDVRMGNVFSVGLVSRVALASDNKASIEAFFNNSTGGFHEVVSGTAVTVSAVKGLGFVANTNKPVFQVRNKQTYSKRTFDRWQIEVGASVAAGNRFKVQDVEIIAEQGDNSFAIGLKFRNFLGGGFEGGAVNPFWIEMSTGKTPAVVAYAGSGISESNKTRWQLGCSYLKAGKSEQLFVQVLTPCESGCYALEAFDKRNNERVGRTQNINISPLHTGESVLLQFAADDRKSFQFEHQKGFVHRVRVRGILDNPKQLIEETERYNINGQLRRGLTQISRKTEYVTDSRGEWYHEAMGAALKHRNVWIDGQEAYTRGEYKLTDRYKGTQKYQAKIDVIQPLRQSRNYGLVCSGCEKPETKLTIIDNIFGVKAILRKCGEDIAEINSSVVVAGGAYEIAISNLHYEGKLIAEIGLCEALQLDLMRGEEVKIQIGNCDKSSIEIRIIEPTYCFHEFDCGCDFCAEAGCSDSGELPTFIEDRLYVDGFIDILND